VCILINFKGPEIKFSVALRFMRFELIISKE